MRYLLITAILLLTAGAFLTYGEHSPALPGGATPSGIPPSGSPLSSAKFGPIWCPKQDTEGYFRVENYPDLPNDPIGDGESRCYMEAFNTSALSTDNKPVRGCANLNLDKFPDHICREVSTPKQFKAMAYKKKLVAIVTNDLEIKQGFEPYISKAQESLIVIGVYDEKYKRPVMIRRGRPAASTLFFWNPESSHSRLVLINLRMRGIDCVKVSDRGATREFVGISLTAKCLGRFIIASAERNNKDSRIDNRFYLKNVLARARNSHTVYLDRTWLNWIEDSLFMGPWENGKHAAKYTGQNVVIRNSLHSNQGVHGRAIADPEYANAKKPWQGKGGLAPISLASCNRAVLDGVTVINHVISGNSNPQPIQWQFRDALGAGCDMPRIYRSENGKGPHKPYYGPAWYEGKLEEPSSAWNETFWRSPRLLESYVINTQIMQSYGEKSPGHGSYHALMTDGTYPSVRNSSTASMRRAAEKIPPGWKERQRIHVSGGCLDNGVYAGSIFDNHYVKGMGKAGKHLFDNTDKFVSYGSNSCKEKESVDDGVVSAMKDYLQILPQPPWTIWQSD